MKRAVVALLSAMLVSGCGLPTNKVTPLDEHAVPFGLLGSAAPTAPPQTQGPRTLVYFVAHDRLVSVPRRVVGENIPAEAARALIAGPTSAESAAGISSDVPTQTHLVSLDVSHSVATADVSSDFGAVGGSDQVLAIAQFVYTLTASQFIDSVRFAIGGKPIEVPDASGSLSSAPRTRVDYKPVAPHA